MSQQRVTPAGPYISRPRSFLTCERQLRVRRRGAVIGEIRAPIAGAPSKFAQSKLNANTGARMTMTASRTIARQAQAILAACAAREPEHAAATTREHLANTVAHVHGYL